MGSTKDTQFSSSIQKIYTPDVFERLENVETRDEVKRRELKAMADTYLGPNYNQDKVEKTILIQLQADRDQDALLYKLEHRLISNEQYLNGLENLFLVTALACEQVLGAEDFEKLFAMPARDAATIIDREHFLSGR